MIPKTFSRIQAHQDRRKKGPTAKRRAAKRRRLDKAELREMNKARERDGYCRFPLCRCRQFVGSIRMHGEVAHQVHRGQGGDPSGERTKTPILLLVCAHRHRLAKFSLDQHTIRWEGLTPAGADGPIRWLIAIPWNVVKGDYFEAPDLESPEPGWGVIATETAPHEYAPFTEAQSAILSLLAEMTC